jgi:ABC-type nitrate/sulfonate/bicarbonate transport system substrate-binding protein
MRYGSSHGWTRGGSVPASVTVGSFTPSVVLDLARTTGRLEAVDLAVTEVPVASSPAQFRDLVDGRLDLALTSPDNVLAYRFSPGNPLGELFDVRIVGAVDRGMGLGLYARPGLTADDLRGARLGVDVPTSGFALALYALADSLGVGRADYELVTLGSTPRRLEALLAGDCDATMLNAGNELAAERAGCPCLASVADVVGPYLGTVVAVAGETRLTEARGLSDALTSTAAELVGGGLDDEAREAAARRLHLDDELAARYVARLRSPGEGLVADGLVDPEAIATLVGLRRRYLPDGLDDTAGLVVPAGSP